MSPELATTGLLVVDKPAGCTSHDVVDRVRRTFQMSKVGHAGTLDPAATGVLLVGLGKATRILTFLQGLPKIYRAVIKFGITTSSQDSEGEILTEVPSHLELGQVVEAARAFEGEIAQLPPMYSAVKVGGEALYRAARRGEEVTRTPRTVRVHELKVESFDADRQQATVLVKCSSGTYVRTLAADLGEKLGTGAHLAQLRRLAIGSFDVEQSFPLEEVEEMDRKTALRTLISMREAMRDFPQVIVQGEDLEAVTHGRALEFGSPPRRLGELPLASAKRSGDRPPHEAGMTAGIPVAMVGPRGDVIAVYRRTARGLKPAAVLV